MSNKYISITLAFLGTVVAVGCTAGVVFAQEGGGAPPPPPSSDSAGVMPPSPGSGGYGMPGGVMPKSGGAEQYGQEYPKQYQQEYQKQYTAEMEQRNKGQPQGGQQQFGRPEIKDPRMMGRPTEGGGFGPGDGGGWGGMGGGDDERMGPSDEEMEKMQNEQEKRMKTEQLKQMKRGVTGLEQGLKQINKMAERLSKKGIAVPSDVTALISELTAEMQKIKNATEFTDEVEAAMEIIQDKGQDIGDVGQRLGMLEQMSQMTKQVEKQFIALDKALATAKKRKEASQFPAVVTKVEGQINALKVRWSEVKQSVLLGDADPDDLRDVTEGIFEEVGEARRSIEMIRQLGSVSKMVKSAEKEIATFEKTIARERKNGKDVSRLDELLAEGKAKLAEVKALVKQSGFEPEDLFEIMQELEAIGDRVHNELDSMSGKKDAKQLSGAVIYGLELRRMGL